MNIMIKVNEEMSREWNAFVKEMEEKQITPDQIRNLLYQVNKWQEFKEETAKKLLLLLAKKYIKQKEKAPLD